MKLLPRKIEIDKIKANERKREIDDGLSLAKRVDALRELKATEEKNLLEYRSNAIKQIQGDIDQRLLRSENLAQEIKLYEKKRYELLAPLNKEWLELNLEKEQIKETNVELYLRKEQLKIEESNLDNKRQELSNIATKIASKKKEIEKIKKETIDLRNKTKEINKLALQEKQNQSDDYEKKIQEVNFLKAGYENGLEIIKKEEQAVKDKEVELIIREKHLESQQQSLKIAYDKIKNK